MPTSNSCAVVLVDNLYNVVHDGFHCRPLSYLQPAHLVIAFFSNVSQFCRYFFLRLFDISNILKFFECNKQMIKNDKKMIKKLIERKKK